MNFFATGNSAVKDGFDLEIISPLNFEGENFASYGQTLWRSYSVAKKIFERTDKAGIKFVLLGLTADVFFLDENENLTTDIFDKNFLALNDYLKLCRDNDTKLFAVILPVAPSLRENYRKRFFEPLFDILSELKKSYDFTIVNLFNAKVSEENFSDKTHLNETGAALLSVSLNSKLRILKIFSEEDFYNMSYKFFNVLSYLGDKNSFQTFMGKIYSHVVNQLRRKKKIKVAFVTDHASAWCGDKLYNLFAKNPRFETTLFLCHSYESDRNDTFHDLEQFKSAGIKAVGIFDLEEETPPQDIIFFLRPYFNHLSKSFQIHRLSPKTLLVHMPYGFLLSTDLNYYNGAFIRMAWKHFLESKHSLKFVNEKCNLGITRGMASGLPRLDAFLENADKFSFKWKMTRPDAKKIIWAPHHSIAGDGSPYGYSTFHWNYQFMYELAKAHPEISWVVKPHPRLFIIALDSGLFPSVDAYEDYMRKWNELPNAQVYTGGYYQNIFATSDGMILDSISFVAEYQYTHKPLIFLLNNSKEEFNELGRELLNISYVVDGKNFAQIAAAVQKIFVEGNDPLKEERQKLFDELLNYKRFNGMDASEFIFKNISQELGVL